MAQPWGLSSRVDTRGRVEGSHRWELERPGQQILVLVASIHMRVLKPEVEEGSSATAVDWGLAGSSVSTTGNLVSRGGGGPGYHGGKVRLRPLPTSTALKPPIKPPRCERAAGEDSCATIWGTWVTVSNTLRGKRAREVGRIALLHK